jgi:hypothetical protein
LEPDLLIQDLVKVYKHDIGQDFFAHSIDLQRPIVANGSLYFSLKSLPHNSMFCSRSLTHARAIESSRGDPLGRLQSQKDRRASISFVCGRTCEFFVPALGGVLLLVFAQLNAKQVHRAARITLWKSSCCSHSQNSTVAMRRSSGFTLLICLRGEWSVLHNPGLRLERTSANIGKCVEKFTALWHQGGQLNSIVFLLYMLDKTSYHQLIIYQKKWFMLTPHSYAYW